MARRSGGSSITRTEFPVGNRRAVLDERGFRDPRKHYRIEERFELLPDLNATAVLATTPTAAAFAAALQVNRRFEHLGTGTEIVTFANQFDFGGGIKLAAATADAASCIILPHLATWVNSDTTTEPSSGFAVSKQWSSERSPRFECVLTPTPAAQITTVALTTNIATITTGAAHGIAIGESVVIVLDQADSDYAATSSLEGTWVVASVPSTTTFTFAYTHANVSSASIAGSCRQATDQVSGVTVGGVITTMDLTSNVVTITTSLAHNFQINQLVNVSFNNAHANYTALIGACQGLQTVTGVTSTTITYAKTASDIVSVAITGNLIEQAKNAQLTKTAIWAGFKKTNTPVVITDDDQAYLLLCTAVSATPITVTAAAISQYWCFVTSRGGVDIVTVLSQFAPPSMGTTYRIEIEIDSNRIPSLWINGVKADLGTGAAALSWGIDFIPHVGVANAGVIPAAKAICLSYIGCSRKEDRSAA